MHTTHSYKRPARGMTLLEMTVVILVMLTLITILFIGAKAWRQGTDRTGCIISIRNAQNAVRSHQNLYNISNGAPINIANEIMGPGNFVEYSPVCPGGGSYTLIDHIPYPGELVMTCSLASSKSHEPEVSTDW
jgi:type II secretory pathway pseudopilin PulG